MTRPQKYRDVKKFLGTKGWVFKRQKGSHEMWGPEDSNMTFPIVQHKGEVSPGVIRQLSELFEDAPKDWKN